MTLERYAEPMGWGLDLPGPLFRHDRRHPDVPQEGAESGRLGADLAGPTDLSGFVALYAETMRRVGAGGSISSRRATGARCRGATGAVVLAEALAEGEVVPRRSASPTPPWLHYHLSAAASKAGHSATEPRPLPDGRVGGRAGLRALPPGGGAGGRGRLARRSFKRRFDPGGRLDWRAGQGRARRGGLPRPDRARRRRGRRLLRRSSASRVWRTQRVPAAFSQITGASPRRLLGRGRQTSPRSRAV